MDKILNKNIWQKLREYIYLILLFGYIFLNIYNDSWVKLGDIIPYFDVLTVTLENIVVPFSLGTLYILNLFLINEDRNFKMVLCQTAVFCVFAVVSVEYDTMLTLGLFLLCSQFTTIKKIAVTAATSVTLVTMLVIIASQTGWTGDRIVERLGRVAHYFGFHHYAIWARQLLFAAAAYLFARGKKTTLAELAVLAVLNYAVFYYSTQRLTFIAGILLIAVFVVFVKFEIVKINNKIIQSLAAIAFPAAWGGSVLLHCFYNESSMWMSKLNTLLSTRLELGKKAFELFDVNLFGQQVHNITEYYFYIDCGYLYLMFAQGIILALIVIAMYGYMYWRCAKTNNTALFCWLTVALIYLLIDNTATDLTCTAVLLLAFLPLCKEHLQEINKKQ